MHVAAQAIDVESPTRVIDCGLRALIGVHDAGDQFCQVENVATIERDVSDLAISNEV